MAKPYSSELFKFSFIPSYDEKVLELAEHMADAEHWDFSDASSKNYQILKNYLEHTYRKLKVEGQICFTPNNRYAAFNTGFVTPNLEEVIA